MSEEESDLEVGGGDETRPGRSESFEDVGKKILKEVVRVGVQELKKEAQDQLGDEVVDMTMEEISGVVLGDYKHLLAGLVYMFTHVETWKLVRIPVKVAIITSSLFLITLLSFVYPFQAYLLETVQISSPVAHVISFGLIFIELIVVEVVFIVPTVYGTLVSRLFIKVYNTNSAKEEWKDRYDFSCGCCCSSTLAALLRFGFHFTTVWLNFMPYVGNWAYITVNSKFYTWELFSVYFERRGITSIWKQFALVKALKLQEPFGAEAVAVKTLPLIGELFSLTNSAGAALYAVEVLDDIDLDEVLQKNEPAGGPSVLDLVI